MAMRIVHISDLHFGEELVSGKVERAVKQINLLEPDLVILTGDITCWGTHSEMRDAYEALSNLQPEVIAVPGNHDARNIGYEYFELYFGKTKKCIKTDGCVIVAADSTQPDLDEGYLGLEQREWIQEKLRGDKTSILVLHHHIVPIPETGRERNVLIDAGEVIELLIRNGVALVLAGHRHMPYSIRLMRTHIVHAGTLGSFKVLGMPDQNYNIMELGDEFITLKLRFVDLGEVEVGKYTIKTDVPESVDIYHKIAKPKKVLFVSRNNACRTRIAEAIFNKISPNNMLALSAGLKASEISPMAIEVLKEIGINPGNRKGRRMTQEQFREFDYVISFDQDIDANEHWDIPEPESLDECRDVRNAIKKRIEELIPRIIV
jgi:protein-tyrosine-phosphatase/predicted phosphodiesterase